MIKKVVASKVRASKVGAFLWAGLLAFLLGYTGLLAGEAEGASCKQNVSQRSEYQSARSVRSRLAATRLPRNFAKWQADYWELLCLERRGDRAGALHLQKRLFKRVPELSGLWWLARARLLHRQKRYELARQSLSDALAVEPPYDVRPEAQQWLRDIFPSGGSRSSSSSALLSYVVEWLEHPLTEDWKLERKLLEQARHWTARQSEDDLLLRTALWRIPSSSADLKKRLLSDKAKADLQAQDWLARLEQLFKLRFYQALVREIDQANLSGWFGHFKRAERAKLGRLYYRARVRSGGQLARDGLRLLQKNEARFAFNKTKQQIWQTRLLLRLGDSTLADKKLRRSNSKLAEWRGMVRELVRLYIRRNQSGQAEYWLRRLSNFYPDSPETVAVYWDFIWRSYRQKDWQTAHKWLKIATKHSSKKASKVHPVDAARFFYWHGRTLQQMGQPDQADKVWQELLKRWPYNFYSALLQQKIQQQFPLSVPKHARAIPVTTVPSSSKLIRRTPAVLIATFLDAIDQPDLARRYFLLIIAEPLSRKLSTELVGLLQYLQRGDLSLALINHQYSAALRQQEPQATELWRQAFPRLHWQLIKTTARKHQVDPFFVLAIIREESRFYAQAVSSAGALGLMQIMPATGKWLARKLKQPSKTQTLITPRTNIRLGTYYLAQLLQKYDRNPFYAAAAYNAGPKRVGRWQKLQAPAQLDQFVENISFTETQNYVRRVYLSYTVYRQIYQN